MDGWQVEHEGRRTSILTLALNSNYTFSEGVCKYKDTPLCLEGEAKYKDKSGGWSWDYETGKVNYFLILMSHLENWAVFQTPNELFE